MLSDAFEGELTRALHAHQLPLTRRPPSTEGPYDPYIRYDVGAMCHIVVDARYHDEVVNVTIRDAASGEALYAGSRPSPQMVADLIVARYAADMTPQPAPDRGMAGRPGDSEPTDTPRRRDRTWLLTPPPGAPQWDYLTTVISANAARHQDFLAEAFPEMAHHAPKYAPEALIPELGEFGAAGWELVHMEPVQVGGNHDIMTHYGGNNNQWSHAYFCVFKRLRI